jgi:hypothetical protein
MTIIAENPKVYAAAPPPPGQSHVTLTFRTTTPDANREVDPLPSQGGTVAVVGLNFAQAGLGVGGNTFVLGTLLVQTIQVAKSPDPEVGALVTITGYPVGASAGVVHDIVISTTPFYKGQPLDVMGNPT